MSCLGLDISSDCIIWTGEGYPQYAIQTGMTLTEVVDAIITHQPGQVEEELISSLNSDQVVFTGRSLLTNVPSTSCLKITQTDMSVSTSPGNSGTQVTYDLKRVVSALPEEFSLIDLKTTIKSENNTTLFNSSSQSASASVRSNEYPAVLSTRAQISSPCGVIELSGSYIINGASEEAVLSLKVNDLTPQNHTQRS